MPKIHSFHNDTYRFNLHVIIGGTCKQASAAFNRKFKANLTHQNGWAGFHSAIDGEKGAASLIWIRTDAETEMADIMAHESLHCAAHQLSSSGVRFSKSSEEAYAYLIGWVGRKVWEAKLAT